MSENLNWNLENIFPGGSESAELHAFLTSLQKDLTAALPIELPTLTPDTQETWVATIQQVYQLTERLRHAGSFVHCLLSQDVNDSKALELSGTIEEMSGQLSNIWTQLSTAFAAQDDDSWASLLNTEALQAVAFHLDEERTTARTKADPDIELLMNDLSTTGYHGWSRLYNVISGAETVDFEGEEVSLGQLQNIYMDNPDRDTRARAFETLEAAWDGLSQPSALALNNQAGFRLSVYKQRGWDVLHEPLENNRLSAETLDTMWGVIDAKSAKLLDYFTAKASLMGRQTLSWFDVAAPVGETNRTFSFGEAGDFVVDTIRTFNPDIADYCRHAIEQNWIESENRPGKRAGAYCTSVPLRKESRIFMTYNGSYNGLLTLAHELGHGYHGWVLRHHPLGAKQYTMSVAETASTFNESIVKQAAFNAAESDEEKLSLLGSKLNDATTMLMNIRSRYDFERAFFTARQQGMVGVGQLNELMLEAQQNAFKNGLDTYHPIFWASKLHFYITRQPFYNFPYVFGYLFSSGVYAQALAEGPEFNERYKALLQDTGSMRTEALAHKHLGVDLTQPEFWENAVDSILADVDNFVALTQKMTVPVAS